jgi:hypothetical protein
LTVGFARRVLASLSTVALGVASASSATAAESSLPSTTVVVPLTDVQQVAVAGDHVFLANESSSSLVVAGPDGALMGRVADVPDVRHLAASHDGSLLYAAQSDRSSIAKIDPATLTNTASWDVGDVGCPTDIAPVEGYVWFRACQADLSTNLGVVDLTGPTPVASTAAEGVPNNGRMVVVGGPSPKLVMNAWKPDTGFVFDVFALSGATATYTESISDTSCFGAADMAVTPDNAHIVLTCPYAIVLRRTTDLAVVRTVPTSESGASIDSALSPDGTRVAVVSGNRTQLWSLDGQSVGAGSFPGGFGRVAFSADGSTLYVGSSGGSITIPRAFLTTFPTAGLDPSELALSAPATSPVGDPITVTGSLTLPVSGSVEAQVVHITRTNFDGSRTSLPDQTTDSSGAFSFTDTPLGGTARYSATWDGDAERRPARASATVNVVRLTAALSVTPSRNPLTYGQTTSLRVHLGAHSSNSRVLLYVKEYGDQVRRLLCAREVNPDGNASCAYAPAVKAVVTAVFRGDDRYAPVSTSVTIVVRMRVDAAQFGYYSTAGSYRLYRATKNPVFGVAVSPRVGGSSIKFLVQEYRAARWRTIIVRDFQLEPDSTVGVRLVGPHPVGPRFRMRYVHPGRPGINRGWSSWLHFRFTR